MRKIVLKEPTIWLSHGAGAGHSSSFMAQFNQVLAEQFNTVIKAYTFDYMLQQELTGKRRPPPRFPLLVSEWQSHILSGQNHLLIGKSMGGRVATQLTKIDGVKGVVCIGFPFYPAGKPEKHRLAFLEALEVPCLVIQGSRDQMGNYDWVSQQSLPNQVDLVWVEGADHDFKRLKKQNISQLETLQELALIIADWRIKHSI
ncbi:alpha/beta family hydrolase [Marinomonas dokdonensis]|uniref:alpha/beta family hydrolase n=1 Tax=Marinomonas dokdonensis TaxID=328224 RepID=UPI00405551E7